VASKQKRGSKPAAPPVAPAPPPSRVREWLAWGLLTLLPAVCGITGYSLRDVMPRQAQREHVGKDTVIASATTHSTVNASATVIASAATHSTANATEAHVNSCLSSCERTLRPDLRLPPL